MHIVHEMQDLSSDELRTPETERRAELIAAVLATAISAAFFVAIGVSLWSRI